MKEKTKTPYNYVVDRYWNAKKVEKVEKVVKKNWPKVMLFTLLVVNVLLTCGIYYKLSEPVIPTVDVDLTSFDIKFERLELKLDNVKEKVEDIDVQPLSPQPLVVNVNSVEEEDSEEDKEEMERTCAKESLYTDTCVWEDDDSKNPKSKICMESNHYCELTKFGGNGVPLCKKRMCEE